MALRLPKDAPPDTLRALRDMQEELRRLATTNPDLRGRRFTGGGRAQAPDEFITKAQFDEEMARVQEAVNRSEQRVRRALVVSSSGGGGTPVPAGGLPAPNHQMDFGYYFVETDPRKGAGYGAYAQEVKDFTNLAYIGGNLLNSEANISDIKVALDVGLRNLTDAGIKIMLDVEAGSTLTIGDSLQIATPYWSNVKYVNYGERGTHLSAADLATEIVAVKSRMTNLGLPHKPIGVTNDNSRVDGTWCDAAGLDFALIEAYSLDPTNHGTSAENIAEIKGRVAAMRGRIPSGVRLGLIFQAYTRNGAFSPVSPDLVDLQDASYMMVANDTRFDMMLLFSYGRPTGTRDNPALIPRHRAIWAAMHSTGGGGGGTGPTGCGQGRLCCGGEDNEPDCPRWCDGGVYQSIFWASQSAYTASAPPTVIDPANRNRVIDAAAYMAGVRDRFNLDQPSYEAQVSPGLSGKEMTVKRKGDSAFSEQYSCWSGGDAESFVRQSYRATCYPARI